MIKTIVEFIPFIFQYSPFLVSLVVWTALATIFSKSIKKYSKAFYWAFGIIALINLLSIASMILGWKFMAFTKWPVLEDFFIEMGYGQYFFHPVLVIIMYMGALSPKIKSVGKLMSIRKELSIIVGFAVVGHAIKRTFLFIPGSVKYFASRSELISDGKILNPLASDIMHGVFILGIVMTILFVVLWVTSFDSVRRKMGAQKWKRVQRWSYALYAMLFIHAIGIDASMYLNVHTRQQKAKTEQLAVATKPIEASNDTTAMPAKPSLMDMATTTGMPPKGIKKEVSKKPAAHSHGRQSGFSFATLEVSSQSKTLGNMLILILIYGSYLYFRVRKAQQDKLKKRK